MSSVLTAARRYRGASADERRAERRERLIEAAIRVYGRTGYHGTTVKAVCEEARLTERYFYESFSNGEALLLATYGAVTDYVFEAVDGAVAQAAGAPRDKVSLGLTRYFEILKNDPATARVFLVEIRGVSEAVDAAAAAALDRFSALLTRTLRPADQGAGLSELLLAGVGGGLNAMAQRWISADASDPVETVVADALQLCAVLAQPEPAAATA